MTANPQSSQPTAPGPGDSGAPAAEPVVPDVGAARLAPGSYPHGRAADAGGR
jgi:hypothetical protein